MHVEKLYVIFITEFVMLVTVLRKMGGMEKFSL
jgi:hypothetical protein